METTDGRTDLRLDERNYGWTDGLTVERTDLRLDGRTYGWTDGRTYGWTDGLTVGRTDLRLDGRTYSWSEGLTDGRTNLRLDGRRDVLRNSWAELSYIQENLHDRKLIVCILLTGILLCLLGAACIGNDYKYIYISLFKKKNFFLYFTPFQGYIVCEILF